MSRGRHILVTGPHRSGTTWIGNTLAQHGGMRILLEPFNRNYPPYGFGLVMKEAYTDFESSSQKEELKAAFDAHLAGGAARYALGVCHATQAGWKTPLRFLWHALESLRRPRVLVKDPLALFSAAWLADRYDLDVICTMRQPFSFVASLKVAEWGFSFKNLLRQKALLERLPPQHVQHMEKLADNREERIEKWSLLWNVLHHQIATYRRSRNDWLFVRYEDVALNPMEGFASMLRHIGLDMNTPVKTYIESYTSSRNPAETNSTAYQPRDAKKTVDSWKTRLTSDEISAIADFTAELREELYPDLDLR